MTDILRRMRESKQNEMSSSQKDKVRRNRESRKSIDEESSNSTPRKLAYCHKGHVMKFVNKNPYGG